jgi:ABC-type Mn2+/Zn2+ transport system permease subunit
VSEFLDAFALFGDAWLTALLLAALLPLCGLVLVARRQVFTGAAIGQAAAFGFAVAILLGLGHDDRPGHTHEETAALTFALAAGIAVAIAALRALSLRSERVEERIAWIFLLGGSGSVLLLSHAPHGLQEVQRLQLSTLLGASPHDKWIAAALLGASLLAALRLAPRALLWALDPTTGHALGLRPWRWDIGVGLWLGACLGFAIHVAGVLFAFGVAVLPPMLAAAVARSLRGTISLAPVLGIAATAAGLVIAHAGDLPPGQVVVGVLAAAWPLGRWLRRR